MVLYLIAAIVLAATLAYLIGYSRGKAKERTEALDMLIQVSRKDTPQTAPLCDHAVTQLPHKSKVRVA